VTCRIDRLSIEQGAVLRISGYREDLHVLRIALEEGRVVRSRLTEVELVDRDAVKLLARTEANGIELRHSPAYIREWVTREHATPSAANTDGNRILSKAVANWLRRRQ